MEIRTWSVQHIFEPALRGDEIQMVGVDLPKPVGLEARIGESWSQQLLKKQKELTSSGIKTEIHPYHLDSSENPLNALYEGDIPKMWPGPVVTLRDIEYGLANGSHRITLKVGQMFYPYIAALKDPEIVKLYEDEAIAVPTPALGICSPVLTADDALALTVRGSRTSIYPLRVHSPGGQPLFPDTKVAKHQRDEIEEELFIKADELVGEVNFTGIVRDEEVLSGKPDLTGWVRTSLDVGDIRERMFRTDPTKRPPDIQGVVFAPASEDGLLKYMTEYTHPVNFCPPTVGSLWLYGVLNYGHGWGNDVVKRMGY